MVLNSWALELLHAQSISPVNCILYQFMNCVKSSEYYWPPQYYWKFLELTNQYNSLEKMMFTQVKTILDILKHHDKICFTSLNFIYFKIKVIFVHT